MHVVRARLTSSALVGILKLSSGMLQPIGLTGSWSQVQLQRTQPPNPFIIRDIIFASLFFTTTIRLLLQVATEINLKALIFLLSKLASRQQNCHAWNSHGCIRTDVLGWCNGEDHVCKLECWLENSSPRRLSLELLPAASSCVHRKRNILHPLRVGLLHAGLDLHCPASFKPSPGVEIEKQIVYS